MSYYYTILPIKGQGILPDFSFSVGRPACAFVILCAKKGFLFFTENFIMLHFCILKYSEVSSGMKCPECGAWNQAYLPRCNRCGAPLVENHEQTAASWEDAMHKKKPSLQVIQFEKGDTDVRPELDDGIYDPEAVDRASLRDELEELEARRRQGTERKAQMKERADRVRRSLQDADIIRSVQNSYSAGYDGDAAAIQARQKQRQARYMRSDASGANSATPQDAQDNDRGYFGDPGYETPLAYADDDPEAPYYYDGYTPESGDQGALTDREYMPRRMQTRAAREEISESFSSTRRKKNRFLRALGTVSLLLLISVAVCAGGILIAREYVINQGLQVQQDNETRVELTKTQVDGHPAHTITVYGKENATMEEVVAAAKAAHIHPFIMRLPEGYQTVISEDGGNISKGQKQLLTIARAMLYDARMLILDEATSNVDTSTEREIQAAMRRLMRGKTCFVIAHRLSTIQHADLILVLNQGDVVEQGTHESLMRQKGFYYRLYTSQFD